MATATGSVRVFFSARQYADEMRRFLDHAASQGQILGLSEISTSLSRLRDQLQMATGNSVPKAKQRNIELPRQNKAHDIMSDLISSTNNGVELLIKVLGVIQHEVHDSATASSAGRFTNTIRRESSVRRKKAEAAESDCLQCLKTLLEKTPAWRIICQRVSYIETILISITSPELNTKCMALEIVLRLLDHPNGFLFTFKALTSLAGRKRDDSRLSIVIAQMRHGLNTSKLHLQILTVRLVNKLITTAVSPSHKIAVQCEAEIAGFDYAATEKLASMAGSVQERDQLRKELKNWKNVYMPIGSGFPSLLKNSTKFANGDSPQRHTPVMFYNGDTLQKEQYTCEKVQESFEHSSSGNDSDSTVRDQREMQRKYQPSRAKNNATPTAVAKEIERHKRRASKTQFLDDDDGFGQTETANFFERASATSSPTNDTMRRKSINGHVTHFVNGTSHRRRSDTNQADIAIGHRTPTLQRRANSESSLLVTTFDNPLFHNSGEKGRRLPRESSSCNLIGSPSREPRDHLRSHSVHGIQDRSGLYNHRRRSGSKERVIPVRKLHTVYNNDNFADDPVHSNTMSAGLLRHLRSVSDIHAAASSRTATPLWDYNGGSAPAIDDQWSTRTTPVHHVGRHETLMTPAQTGEFLDGRERSANGYTYPGDGSVGIGTATVVRTVEGNRYQKGPTAHRQMSNCSDRADFEGIERPGSRGPDDISGQKSTMKGFSYLFPKKPVVSDLPLKRSATPQPFQLQRSTESMRKIPLMRQISSTPVPQSNGNYAPHNASVSSYPSFDRDGVTPSFDFDKYRSQFQPMVIHVNNDSNNNNTSQKQSIDARNRPINGSTTLSSFSGAKSPKGTAAVYANNNHYPDNVVTYIPVDSAAPSLNRNYKDPPQKIPAHPDDDNLPWPPAPVAHVGRAETPGDATPFVVERQGFDPETGATFYHREERAPDGRLVYKYSTTRSGANGTTTTAGADSGGIRLAIPTLPASKLQNRSPVAGINGTAARATPQNGATRIGIPRCVAPPEIKISQDDVDDALNRFDYLNEYSVEDGQSYGRGGPSSGKPSPAYPDSSTLYRQL